MQFFNNMTSGATGPGSLPPPPSYGQSRSQNIGLSSGMSQALSGEAWNPQQMAQIAQLYPQIFQRLQQNNQLPSFGSVLSQAGGPALDLGNPYAIPSAYNFNTNIPTGIGGGSPVTPRSFGAFSMPTGADIPNAGMPIGISQAPVLSQEQIQAQVNLARAQGDQSTQGQQRLLAGSLAGKGYGAASPLQQALSANMQEQNLAQNTSNETGLRTQAAQMNAQQMLAAQTAAAQQNVALSGQNVQAGIGRSNYQLGAYQTLSQDQLRRAQLQQEEEIAQGQQSVGAAATQAQYQLGAYNTNQRAQEAAANNQMGLSQLGIQQQLGRQQLQSQNQLGRQQLGVSQYGQLLQNQAQQQNTLLSALGYYNRPLPYSNSSSKNQSYSQGYSYS